MNINKKLSLAVLAGLSISTVTHAGTANLTGQYFGKHELIMATPGDAGSLGSLARQITNNGTPYGVLGWNMSKTYWLWDFDTNTITFGSSNLAAMNFFATPHYRVYAPDRARIDGELYAPDMDGPTDVDEMKATFVDNGDGTYSAEFRFQIYFSMAGYPMGEIHAKYEITENEDGQLKIVTLDEGPDGVLGADGETNDGLPGVVLPSIMEDPDNGVFPLRVSPYWNSDVMTKITTDTNDDGIPDTVAKELGLLAGSSDTDGDGIADIDEIGANWAMPLDSDNDYIPDVLEAGDAANDDTVLSNMLLASNEKVTVTALNGDVFTWDDNTIDWILNYGTDDQESVKRTARFSIAAEAVALEPQWIPGGISIYDKAEESLAAEDVLPITDDNGNAYVYDMGTFQYYITSDYSDYDIYKGIEAMLKLVVTAEGRIPYFEARIMGYETSIAEYQVLLDQAIADGDTDEQATQEANIAKYQGYVDSNTTSLTAAETNLPVVKATVADFMVNNSRWVDPALELFGSSFSDVTTLEEFETLVAALNLVADDLGDSSSYELYFEHGVPDGFKVIRLHDIWSTKLLYDENDILTGSEPTNWQPTIDDVPFVAHEDGKTITVTHNRFKVNGDWVYQQDIRDFVNPNNIDVDGDYRQNRKRYQVVFAHTDANRAATINNAPVIEGTAETSIKQDGTYSFIPTVMDNDGDKLTFSIVNKPEWASFNTTTGELSGTPTASETTDIVISVSDKYATTALDAFDLTVTKKSSSSGGSFFWLLLPSFFALCLRTRKRKLSRLFNY